MKTLKKYKLLTILGFLLLVGPFTHVYGQVNFIQGFSFGEFYPMGAGGYIKVQSNGLIERSGVVNLGGTVYHSILSVRTTGRNRQIFVHVATPEIQLTRAGGGESMRLILDQPEPSIYIHPQGNFTQQINIGGTLLVGNISTNPPGNYIGSFTITVNNY
jgi:hypothetical protein